MDCFLFFTVYILFISILMEMKCCIRTQLLLLLMVGVEFHFFFSKVFYRCSYFIFSRYNDCYSVIIT